MLIYRGSFSILHVCGGDPIHGFALSLVAVYSPRVWRWSFRNLVQVFANDVFSTCVEVILIQMKGEVIPDGILHVCGGDPKTKTHWTSGQRYSPRVWRWSQIWWISWLEFWVFSTCVEVILDFSKIKFRKQCILHVCGGDPQPLFQSWTL